jgi:hypothetical protein
MMATTSGDVIYSRQEGWQPLKRKLGGTKVQKFQVTYKSEKNGIEHTDVIYGESKEEIKNDYLSDGFFSVKVKAVK